MLVALKGGNFMGEERALIGLGWVPISIFKNTFLLICLNFEKVQTGCLVGNPVGLQLIAFTQSQNFLLDFFSHGTNNNIENFPNMKDSYELGITMGLGSTKWNQILREQKVVLVFQLCESMFNPRSTAFECTHSTQVVAPSSKKLEKETSWLNNPNTHTHVNIYDTTGETWWGKSLLQLRTIGLCVLSVAWIMKRAVHFMSTRKLPRQGIASKNRSTDEGTLCI